MRKKLSIIIPAYNAEKYIVRCVDSIILSAKKTNCENDVEVFVINDGSTDETEEKLQRYSEYDYIHVYKKYHEGVSAARNYGLEVADSEYITFIDADDYVGESYFGSVLSALSGCEADLILFSKYYSDCNGITVSEHLASLPYGYIEKSRLMEVVLDQKTNNLWNKIFKTEVIKAADLKFDKNLVISEDFLFVFNYISKTEKIFLCEKIEYYYYFNPFGSKTTKKTYLNNIFYVFHSLQKRVADAFTEKEYEIFLSRLMHQALEYIGYYSLNDIPYVLDPDFVQEVKMYKFRSLKANIEKNIFRLNKKSVYRFFYKMCWK